ncbi:MAG: M20/M25/M40 family metallo-hydrolase [Clostridia bacterium]|nr:M20/M25/M40 family metallo-hydrolase [Clostridia bacterium]
MFELLKKLCKASGVAGRENEIRNTLAEIMQPLCDEMHTDNMGNLICFKQGKGENREKIMLCGHMDEIGFIATYIESDGMIRISSLGGINFTASAFSKVVFNNGVEGVLVPEGGATPPYSFDKVYVDIGAKDKKSAEKKVAVGDILRCVPSLTRLSYGRVCGRPVDDRVGCAVVVDVAKKVASSPVNDDLYYVFSVQEEVGCRGSRTAAFSVKPDRCLVYDVTGTGDTKGSKPMKCSVGSGAAIKIKDSSVICNDIMVEELIECAKSNKIKHQLEILNYGGTDTSSIQASGAIAAAISIPCRYIHSSVETIDMADVKACSELTFAYLNGKN